MDTVKINKYFEGAKKFPEFNKQEIEIFINSFEEFDTDGSGAIDAKELAAAFKKMGQGASPEQIQEIIDRVDTDKSGQIEWVEFLAVMRDFYPSKRIDYEQNFVLPAKKFPEFSKGDFEVFVDTFREFDLDGSGSIDARELFVAFRTMGQGISREEVYQLIEQFDEDESGEIEFGEFLQMMRMFYPDKRATFERTYYEPAKKYPEFSRDEIDTFIGTFKEYDVDGSGSINSQELVLAFKRMGQGCSAEKAQSIIDEVDVDGSGEIEWPEFLEIMRGFYPYKKREYERQYFEPAMDFPEFSKGDIEAFIQAFREFDLDGSGSINAQELAIAFKRMGQGCTPSQIQSIIGEVDKDGSGEIEWNEFLHIMRMMYPNKMAEYKKQFLEPAAKFTEFDQEDIEVFVQCFREFDTDSSGSIDAHELGAAFKRLGQGVTTAQLSEIINSADDNGNGELEFGEFLTVMHKLYTGELVVKSEPAPTSAPAKTSTPAQTSAPAKSSTPAQTSAPAKTTTQSSTTSSAPAKSTTQASTAPAKSTTTTTSTAPAKTTTTSTQSSTAPAKSTTSTSTSTTSSAPAKTTTTPTKSSDAPKTQIGGQRLPNPTCASCGKTVYPIEEIKAAEQVFHKGCFKCSEPGCGMGLNLKTFKSASGKIFCVKHVPAMKPTSVTIDGSLTAMNAANAPKLQKASGIKKDSRMTFGPGELPTTNSDTK